MRTNIALLSAQILHAMVEGLIWLRGAAERSRAGVAGVWRRNPIGDEDMFKIVRFRGSAPPERKKKWMLPGQVWCYQAYLIGWILFG